MSKKRTSAVRCSFETGAPRHFLYPALLLLLAEEPRHGYRLVDSLLRLGFGPFDRPSVYRALADLQSDGLLRSWEAAPTAGSTRQVYAVTGDGHSALAEWMAAVDDEQHLLAGVVKRYDALLGRATTDDDDDGDEDSDDALNDDARDDDD
jgi:DNA-binding PadR family transcriptional regulator